MKKLLIVLLFPFSALSQNADIFEIILKNDLKDLESYFSTYPMTETGVIGEYRNANILEFSVAKSSPEVVNYLASKGMDINVRSKLEGNLIHTAAMHCRFENYKLLKEKGVNLHTIDKYGNSAIHIAALHLCSEIYNDLKNSGVNPLLIGGKGRTAQDIFESMERLNNKQSQEPE